MLETPQEENVTAHKFVYYRDKPEDTSLVSIVGSQQ